METVLSFAKLTFYPKYVVCHICEAQVLDNEKATTLKNIILDYYNNKCFIYVTHRIHSYSVDPSVYRDVSLQKPLIAFAFVSENETALKSAHFEKMFLKKPLGVFKTLEETIPWIEKTYETYCNENCIK